MNRASFLKRFVSGKFVQSSRRLAMLRKLILCALASAAMIPAAALAHPGGGGGGPGGGGGMGMGNAGGLGRGGPMGMGAGAGGIGIGNSGMGGMSDVGVSTRDASRINSEGPSHASETGIDHANQNSVLAGTSSITSVTTGALAGLTTGTTLFSNGTAVGTVQQIRTTGRGSVAMIVIKGTNGGFFVVPANKLSFAGGTLSTTARFNGINATTSVAANSQMRVNSQGPMHASATGIAHANSHSVLAGTSTGARLTGVSVGMPLINNGMQVGTVVRVVTARGVIERVLVQSSSGRIFSLSPSTLMASGGSLTTTASLRLR
jgi:hypothetical protein